MLLQSFFQSVQCNAITTCEDAQINDGKIKEIYCLSFFLKTVLELKKKRKCLCLWKKCSIFERCKVVGNCYVAQCSVDIFFSNYLEIMLGIILQKWSNIAVLHCHTRAELDSLTFNPVHWIKFSLWPSICIFAIEMTCWKKWIMFENWWQQCAWK